MRIFQHGNLVHPITISDIENIPENWYDITDITDITDSMSHDEIEEIMGLRVEPPFFIESYKANKQRELNQWHETTTKAMKAKYTSAEIEAFMDKRNEALAWRADSSAPTPYVSAMVGGVEEARISLLNSILAKVDAVAQAEMYVLMTRDVIESCTTKEEIDAVVFPNV